MVAVADRIDGWRNDPPRRLIHRESFRASVLHHSGSHAVPQSIAAKKCLLTTPSLLSRGTLKSVCGVALERSPRRRRKAAPTFGINADLGARRSGGDRRRGGVCFVRWGRRGCWWRGGRSGRSGGGGTRV